MIGNNSSIVSVDGLGQFFTSKLNIWITCAFTLALALVYLYFASVHEYRVFPGNKDFNVIIYTDSSVGGNSRVVNHCLSDSLLRLDFELGKAIQSPYVGVSVAPVAGMGLDVSTYNQVSICIRGINTRTFGISLINPVASYSPAMRSHDVMFCSTIDVSPERTLYHINVDQLKVPDWWRDINGVKDNDALALDLGKVLNINFGNAYNPTIEGVKTYEISSISFSRDNKPLAWMLLFSELGFLIVLFLTFLISRNRNAIKIIGITTSTAVDTKPGSVAENGFISYINNNFHNSDLSLDMVAMETNTSQRAITSHIQNKYSCNFKTYVNRLRMAESKRLLAGTDLYIGEIAYKVGFNNQTHFNRVFKAEMQISPTEYRENQHE